MMQEEKHESRILKLVCMYDRSAENVGDHTLCAILVLGSSRRLQNTRIMCVCVCVCVCVFVR